MAGQAELKFPSYGVQSTGSEYGHAVGVGVATIAEDDAIELMTGVPVDNEEDADKLEMVVVIAEDELLCAGTALQSLTNVSETPAPSYLLSETSSLKSVQVYRPTKSV